MSAVATSTSNDSTTVKAVNRSKVPPLPSYIIFSVLLVPRLLAAQYSILSDCDEVYNYWEPTHYLVHGSGFQTWEYSPLYAIRSWTYIAIHASVVKIFDLLQFSKVQQFYGLRVVLGIFSALCEKSLVTNVWLYQSHSIANYLMLILCASAGMFVASTAYLPSTFAMYGVTLAHAFALQPRSKFRTFKIFSTIGMTAVVSWPFAGVLAVVLALHELVHTEGILSKICELFSAVVRAGVAVLLVLIVLVFIDSIAYRRFQIVPLNIVLYNVFSGADRGPNLFGTEPWWYYFLNLLLYFNVMSIAAWASFPLLALASWLRNSSTLWSFLRSHTIMLSVYLWVGILIMQPHKEERFMYVIYPLICYNAAHAVAAFTQIVGVLSGSRLRPALSRAVVTVLLWSVFIIYTILSLARVLAQVRAFSSCIHVYGHLEGSSTVCLGKEWYRFPSSFFVPKGGQALFVKSAFNGLLPGRFPEQEARTGWRSGTWQIPEGMNDLNLEETSHHVSLQECDYFIDSDFPLRYPLMSDVWARIDCQRFLDAPNSGLFGRSLWLPIQVLDKTSWGEFCVLKRIRKAT